jgi:ATPase family protein associated with various cellular activities (AAA)
MSSTNGAVIEAEIGWFSRLLDLRFRIHAGEARGDVLRLCPPPPLPLPFAEGEAAYAEAVRDAGLSEAERLILILAILPHLRPQALDPLLIKNHSSERRFTEFGGADGAGRSGFRPTRETALFLLAGEDMDLRLAALRLFEPGRPLQARHILELADEPGEAGPWLPLLVSERWIGRLTTGAATAPRFGPAFPAQLLETAYELDDLVLGESVDEEIQELLAWVAHERVLMRDWGLARHVKPGYRALFHGPPGTGKTVTAAVLGKELGVPVYRVDLSRVVSKWIGETEKNLAALFDQAAEGGMILFFDEADALFGKRGDTRSANDRHANQQIAYLLQRIEECPGVVILASNLKANIDAAFARRFQAMVYFPMPDEKARLRLWEGAFAGLPANQVAALKFVAIAREHELSGGSIVNVLRHACTQAAARNTAIAESDIRAGIARELGKEGRHAV